MPKKTGLGRGLDALLPDVQDTLTQIDSPVAQTVDTDAVLEIPIHSIDPNKDQPRRTFDAESLNALSASILNSGVISPILVAREGKRYTIIAGERRWRAARLAGLEKIPAIVRDWDDIRKAEAALIENIQRDDLNPIEEAEGIRRLMDQYSFTQEKVAERLGKSRPVIANLLRLLNLPEKIRASVIDGALSAGHARVLAGIDDAEWQNTLYERTIAQQWSVRQLEAAAKAPREKKPKTPSDEPTHILPPEYDELCEILRTHTGLKVQIQGQKEKGKIILEYTDAESLQKLWDLLSEN